MGSWKGDLKNPAPNSVQEAINRSEKLIGDNRALQVRRDKDKQKDFLVSFYDIDETIMSHLSQMRLQVEDASKQIRVPIIYGSPEKWTSSQRDGYFRDKQGKVILPLIMLKRTTSENDTTMQFFNRYLTASVIKLYSSKNKYTPFNVLTQRQQYNAPVNDVYNVVFPSHMLLTYHFVIWTEYVEQMNPLVSAIQFATKDYWGSRTGFKFRTRVESYSHTVEVQSTEDRIVKTEFDLTVHGYILPDILQLLDRRKSTVQKVLTPKKIVMGIEVVATGFELNKFDTSREHWQNPQYPNIRADIPIPQPPVTVNTTIIDGISAIKVDNSPLFLRIVPVPTSMSSAGQDGDMSYDAEYFYFHTNKAWQRMSIAEFIPVCSDSVPLTGTEGQTAFNSQFFYIYSKGTWRKVSLAGVNITTPGQEGDVMYDTTYFYIYTGGSWRRLAVAAF